MLLNIIAPRTNNFTLAARAGKLIRLAFEPYIQSCMGGTITNRMMKVLMQVYKSSTPSSGRNIFQNGNVNLLKGFSFNSRVDLFKVFGEPFTVSINRIAREVTLDVPAFNPLFSFSKLQYGTHFKIICAVAELDFNNDWFNTVELSSKLIRTDLNDNFTTIHEVRKITPWSSKAFIAIVGIQFFAQQGSGIYPLTNGALTPLDIVWVDAERWQ